jgi:dCTP diphosphatase
VTGPEAHDAPDDADTENLAAGLRFDSLQQVLRDFARERDWEQFHSPKNLAMALAVEASELLEIFQWLDEAASGSLPEADLDRAAQEIADVQIYLARIADVLGIDIASAVATKLEINRRKYPADRARGSANKYTRYQDD